jgi:hypothetical protein
MKVVFLVPESVQETMKQICRVALVACLSIAAGCGSRTTLSSEVNSDPQKLPFDRPPQTGGISPSHTLVPSARHIPEGTAITVSLERSLSSGSARNNDAFIAVVDDPIVIDGQTVVPGGARVSGRVLDAKSATAPRESGYLRIALVALNLSEKQIPIATSSLFAKGGSHDDRAGTGPTSDVGPTAQSAPSSKEMVFVPGRRLTFRFTQNIDLQ